MITRMCARCKRIMGFKIASNSGISHGLCINCAFVMLIESSDVPFIPANMDAFGLNNFLSGSFK